MIFDQRDFDVRFEWGPHGVAQLAPNSDAVVIVDVLTFSTAVVVAAAKGAATLQGCVSGRELIGWGFPEDVVAAAQLNSDHVAPRLRDGAFTAAPVPR